MYLKNYTSNVPVVRTISNIEQLLAKFGATHIAKCYGQNGIVLSIQFMIKWDDKDYVIDLPANASSVFMLLQSEYPRRDPKLLGEQAGRTAWKLMQNWVEIQLTLIQTRQVEPLQVFLPYVWDGKRTFYKAIKDSGYRALLSEGVRNVMNGA